MILQVSELVSGIYVGTTPQPIGTLDTEQKAAAPATELPHSEFQPIGALGSGYLEMYAGAVGSGYDWRFVPSMREDIDWTKRSLQKHRAAMKLLWTRHSRCSREQSTSFRQRFLFDGMSPCIAMQNTIRPDEELLPYKNHKLSVEERVEDLLQRMTVAEKAGLLFQNMIKPRDDGALQQDHDPLFNIPSTEELIKHKLMSHFNLFGPVTNARQIAEWHNLLQEQALQTRLGIPITLSSDPRSHFTDNVGTGAEAGVLSQWPETLGLAALRSPELVERFASVAKEEYMALGIRLALHPQVDLATEPRWARLGASFGEDASLSSELVAAYIRGFQGTSLGPTSVSTMTKHFPGGGPQKDGEDPHFTYGKDQVYPGNQFEYHLRPFQAAIAAGAAQIMPCEPTQS